MAGVDTERRVRSAPLSSWVPWKASYFWMRDQRDRAMRDANRLRRMLDPGYVEGDLVQGADW